MPTTALMSILPPDGWKFMPDWGDEVAGQRGGQIRVKQLRPDLWAARYESGSLRPEQIRDIKGIIADMGGSRTTFYAWDPGAQYPRSDPGGRGLLGATVQIESINADNQRLGLKGLPRGYVLRKGDLLAFDYGTGPSRALHIVRTDTVIAAATGITPQFHVAPNVRPGASVNATVTLVKPAAEMMILPGTLDISENPRRRSVSFEAGQVI
jgi:hypothetical protein